MKLHYYSLTATGEITEDVLTARKNKDHYVVIDGTYGGVIHTGTFRYYHRLENTVTDYFSETAHIFSSKKIIIDENLKKYAVLRAEKYKEIVKASESLVLSFLE